MIADTPSDEGTTLELRTEQDYTSIVHHQLGHITLFRGMVSKAPTPGSATQYPIDVISITFTKNDLEPDTASLEARERYDNIFRPFPRYAALGSANSILEAFEKELGQNPLIQA